METQIDLKNVNLYLIGMTGVDKAATGKLLAQQLGYKFFDTDVLIAQLAKVSVDDLMAQQGEAEVRSLETQVLAQVSAYIRLVVATGDGIVLNSANWSHLQQGLVVWLDLPVPLIWERQQTLPHSLSLDDLEQQMQARRHLYAQADVHVVLDEQWSPAEVVTRIYSGVAQVIKTDPPAVP